MSENKQMQSFSPVNYKKGQGPLLHSTVGITRRAAEHVSCSKIKEKLLGLPVFLSFFSPYEQLLYQKKKHLDLAFYS